MKDMNKNYKKMNFADESGFTLMELIVVIGIIIILIALLVPKFSGMTDKANAAAVQNDARICLTALSSYVTGTQGAGKTPDKATAEKEINRALGNDAGGAVDGITVAATVNGNDISATVQEQRGGLTYIATIDAGQGKITQTTCSGDNSRCEALNDSGLLINYKATTTTPNK